MVNQKNVEALAAALRECAGAFEGVDWIDGDLTLVAADLASQGVLVPSTLTDMQAMGIGYAGVNVYGDEGEYRETDREEMVKEMEKIARGE